MGTCSQSNANRESAARVTTGPPVADTNFLCTPPRVNPSRKSTVRVTTGPPVDDTNFSIDPDYLQLEAVTLQRQQTALQAQQNRIVELLAVNQNKLNSHNLVFPFLMGILSTIVVSFGRLRV